MTAESIVQNERTPPQPEPADVTSEPRWRRRPDDRPGEILSAAVEVLAERGYSGCRMEEVARRAGVAKGTVYVYFPTKLDLVKALVTQAPDELSGLLAGAGGSGPVYDDLRRIIEAIWTIVSDPRIATVYRALHAGENELAELAALYVRELTQRATQALRAVVERGLAEGVLRPCDALEVSRMIVALVFQHVGWCRDPVLSASIGLAEGGQVLNRIEAFYLMALEA